MIRGFAFLIAFVYVDSLTPGGINVCTYKASRGTSYTSSCGFWGWGRCRRHVTRYWVAYKCCNGYHTRDGRNCDYADSCGDPGTPTNGYKSGSAYSYGETVYYSCKTHYQLVGDSYRQCKKDGTWSGNLPSCVLVNACHSSPCRHGSTCSNVGSTYRCTCVPGYRGTQCTEAIPCGHPGSINNGYVIGTLFTYGSNVTYGCDHHYNITGGNLIRTCQANGSWSGESPSCKFADTCNTRRPCKNNATCIDGIDEYRCICSGSWGGINCDKDMHPPEMFDCPSDILQYSAEPVLHVNWTEPIFVDPFGSQLIFTSNYQDASFEFPWGEYIVSYEALKPSNGLKQTCKFSVVVRPHSCPELNIPINGAKVCSNWKTDFGRLCLVYCQQGFRLRRGLEHRQWYVCGASGNWRPEAPLPDCNEKVDVSAKDSDISVSSFIYNSCEEEASLDGIKLSFLNRLDTSAFSFFCRRFRNQCNKDNVSVQCN